MTAAQLQHTAELLELIQGARRAQLEMAQHGARFIMAALAASGRQPLTKRQQEYLPALRKFAGRYPGKAIPITALLTRWEHGRMLPGYLYRGLARWEVRDDGPYYVVKEVGEP